MEIVDGRPYLAEVKALIIEYLDSLGRNLSFQNVEEELSDPGKKYTPPEGEIIVAIGNHSDVLGVVAYHRHSDTRCEMKRLYVTPKGRGEGAGDALIKEIIRRAKAAGYREMVLDTVKPLKAAIHLYTKNGFTPCEPYYHNPFDDVIYMSKEL